MDRASEFLAGRADWADIVGAPDITEVLREVSIPCLKELAPNTTDSISRSSLQLLSWALLVRSVEHCPQDLHSTH